MSAAFIVIAMASAATAAEPATNPSLTKDWVFEAGAIFQQLDGDATSEGGLTGGTVRFSQIGLDGTETVPYLAMRWRFADDWRFDFNFTSLDASGSKGNNSDFEFGHSTFLLGYQLNSSYDQQVYTGSIGYSFVKDNQTEFGGRFGLSVLHADVSLKGQLGRPPHRWDPKRPATLGSCRPSDCMEPMPSPTNGPSMGLSTVWPSAMKDTKATTSPRPRT